MLWSLQQDLIVFLARKLNGIMFLPSAVHFQLMMSLLFKFQLTRLLFFQLDEHGT